MTALNDVHALVVDDNQQMRLLVRCLLRAGGLANVFEAKTADEAFHIIRSRQIDLVIVDWMMQPVDGLEFTRTMRLDSTSPNPYMPILMLTAHTEASRVTAARDAGVTGFIKKPISTRMLFARVAGALTDTRSFIRTCDFFGPDRRHGVAPNYAGPLRRSSDDARTHTIDLDDLNAA
jgi:two-component system, chemotaxis family, chemotaxis protein CheY